MRTTTTKGPGMAEPLAMAEPLDERLEHSPLKLVVCQVRFDHTLAVSDPRRAIQAQERLGDRYPQVTEFKQQDVQVNLGPAGASAGTSDPQVGWQLNSDDERWTITLQTGFASLETSAYQDWKDFSQRFASLLDVLADLYQPTLEQRLGLRYVDEIHRPEMSAAAEWSGLIDSAVLGLIVDPDVGPSVRATQQIVELEGPEHLRILLRHGCEPVASGQGMVYRLDHDCFRQRGRSFETATVLATLEELHGLALQVFQKAITPALYAQLKGQV